VMRTEQSVREEQRFLLGCMILPQARNLYTMEPGMWTCDCPAHKDTSRSLLITFGQQPSGLDLKCKRGCSLYAICEGFDVHAVVLFPHLWFALLEQQTAYIEADTGRYINWFKTAMKSGMKLTDDEKHEYRAAVIKMATVSKAVA